LPERERRKSTRPTNPAPKAVSTVAFSFFGSFPRHGCSSEESHIRKSAEPEKSMGQQRRLRLVAEGLTLIERRDSMGLFRDEAAAQYERRTGSIWRPRAGSRVSHRAHTAAMIDSRDFLAANAAPRTKSCFPPGRRSPSPAGSTSTIIAPSGTGSTRFAPNIPTWSAARRKPRKAPSASPPAGQQRAANRLQARLGASHQGRALQT
jgi:hypothetical protein